MNDISLKDFKDHIDDHLNHVVNDQTELVVHRDEEKPVVVVAASEWEAMKETLYLLSDPANRDHLRQSLAQARRGEVEEHDLIQP